MDFLRLCCFIFNLVAIRKGIPDNELLERLARKIPNHWKTLGRRLEMKEADLDSIDKEKDQCCEKAYKMLMTWKEAKGDEATFPTLSKALCHDLVDRKDLAGTLCCD